MKSEKAKSKKRTIPRHATSLVRIAGELEMTAYNHFLCDTDAYKVLLSTALALNNEAKRVRRMKRR